MRIISGTLKGRKLQSIPGTATRPTADRLRESLFNILSRDIRDVVVLDLFAGTGALGIEALSRGAASAVFIDNNTRAVAAVRRNIAACGIEERARVIHWNVLGNLNCIRKHQPAFDLVLMDPPYNTGAVRPAIDHLRRSGALHPSARVVVEHAASEPAPRDIPAFEMTDQRTYGKTVFTFLEFRALP